MENKQQDYQLEKGNFGIISLDLIDDPKLPLRTDLSPESVTELVASIRQFGIIEPLVVKRVLKRFEIIAGHRRLIAASLAGLVSVPCYIFNVPAEEAEFVKIHENLYREEVRPSDQAEHFSYLIQHYKLSPAKIAKLIGKSETFVSERLQILSYPDELREALDSSKIKYSVAREFYRLKNIDKLKEYLGYATKNGIAPSLARIWVDDFLRSQEIKRTTAVDDMSEESSPVYVEQQTTCVYCTQVLKLSEAEIVYMHPQCFKSVAPN